MGEVIVLVIVVIIVVVVVRSNKRKTEALELLNSSAAHELAVKIKDELVKKGGYRFSFEEPRTSFSFSYAYGYFLGSFFNNGIHQPGNSVQITYSEYGRGLHDSMQILRMQIAGGGRYYGIENENIGILVHSLDEADSRDMPEYIKIAADVIKNCGYGESTLVKV
jgi:hypothetical protein